HPDLPPFPTRRSSDLSSPSSFQRLSFMPSVLIPMPRATAVLARWPLNCWSVLRMTFFSISASGLPASSSTADDPPDARPPGRPRSEEHTSELQSLRHL